MGPSETELMAAFRAGYQSIDDGLTFWDGFGASLIEQGYRHQPQVACTCPDQGRHGHMPECRWIKQDRGLSQ